MMLYFAQLPGTNLLNMYYILFAMAIYHQSFKHDSGYRKVKRKHLNRDLIEHRNISFTIFLDNNL